ncbi:hypothetical protein ACROSR_15330 [Roseovarius tibetensis]|uniref:hypothetical protein n=1 Tax=Roseovarius tibetensis TaxID=2685897 RepID=UPI003D7F5FC3
MPVDRAYGSSIVGLAAPGTAEAIEIWRGASANRLGATLLGGAINFISPRAATTPGSELRLGSGSFGHGNIALPLVVDQVRPDQAAFIPDEECVLSGNRVWFLIATWFGKR